MKTSNGVEKNIVALPGLAMLLIFLKILQIRE